MRIIRCREPVNSVTHTAGALLAVVALVVLVYHAATAGKTLQVIGFSIFGASLVGMYVASALYHSLPLSPAGVVWLRRVDHLMVFVLIAGTYTPISLVALESPWRWIVLGIVWALALWGVVLKLSRAPTCEGWSAVLYVLMGLVSLIAAPPLLRILPVGGIAWIVAGGAVYIVGTVIMGLGRPKPFPGVIEAHELWHFFVIGGSACHFWVMLRYIVPLG